MILLLVREIVRADRSQLRANLPHKLSMVEALRPRVLLHVQVEAVEALLNALRELFDELLLVGRVLKNAHACGMVDKTGIIGAFRLFFLDTLMELSILR